MRREWDLRLQSIPSPWSSLDCPKTGSRASTRPGSSRRVTERLNTSFAVDLLNATNHTNFTGPQTNPTNKDFGRVTTQRGLSRVIQFNLRVDF